MAINNRASPADQARKIKDMAQEEALLFVPTALRDGMKPDENGQRKLSANTVMAILCEKALSYSRPQGDRGQSLSSPEAVNEVKGIVKEIVSKKIWPDDWSPKLRESIERINKQDPRLASMGEKAPIDARLVDLHLKELEVLSRIEHGNNRKPLADDLRGLNNDRNSYMNAIQSAAKKQSKGITDPSEFLNEHSTASNIDRNLRQKLDARQPSRVAPRADSSATNPREINPALGGEEPLAGPARPSTERVYNPVPGAAYGARGSSYVAVPSAPNEDAGVVRNYAPVATAPIYGATASSGVYAPVAGPPAAVYGASAAAQRPNAAIPPSPETNYSAIAADVPRPATAEQRPNAAAPPSPETNYAAISAAIPRPVSSRAPEYSAMPAASSPAANRDYGQDTMQSFPHRQAAYGPAMRVDGPSPSNSASSRQPPPSAPDPGDERTQRVAPPLPSNSAPQYGRLRSEPAPAAAAPPLTPPPTPPTPPTSPRVGRIVTQFENNGMLGSPPPVPPPPRVKTQADVPPGKLGPPPPLPPPRRGQHIQNPRDVSSNQAGTTPSQSQSPRAMVDTARNQRATTTFPQGPPPPKPPRPGQ